ncbi:caspase family protein [Nocardia bovistercoris]|uniref:Caspase family protein n=1 Tax=Nocardia bovistercoris TaxID=2785916 RepID=A0A931N467_9NOCA|nr:caspase family protein [Nocardia bovistercoris]MBH0781415.1 caspase family protein [Nocardia bovistercoris]
MTVSKTETEAKSYRHAVAIVCGASNWPVGPFRASTAFAITARGWCDYFGDGLGIRSENLLDLFDSEELADAQLTTIADFLRKRAEALRCDNGQGLLVLFLYIGHGTFTGKKSEYIVLLRARGHLQTLPSYISVAAIAELLEDVVCRSSRIVVLDSCFAGAAVASFMSDPAMLEGVKVQQILDHDPLSAGVSVLCAASRDDAAQFDEHGRYTLFGNAVLTVLWSGIAGDTKRLSLRQVCNNAKDLLRPAELPTPEVHSPEQSDCDLADLDIFPNLQSSQYDWYTKYLAEAEPIVLSNTAAPQKPPTVLRKPPAVSEANTPRNRRWRLPAILGVVVVAGGVILGGARIVIDWPTTSAGFDTSLIGADSSDRGCATDAQVLRATAENPDFLLEIVWSAHCNTAWAQITWRRTPGLPEMIEARVYPKSHDPTGPDAQSSVKPNVGFTRTHMVDRGTRGSVCAIGNVVIDGRGSPSPVELCG